ncbi:MAG: MBL fold metallo-hydrolase [Rhodoferax sp.]|nr:MBL fold metallo-hydrolase [Rhodoferax sp.]
MKKFWPWLKWLLAALLLLLVTGVASVTWMLAHPPALTPFDSLRWPDTAVPSSPLKVSFLGVATVLLDDGETALMTDAFFSRPDRMSSLAGTVQPDLDAITRGMQRAGIGQRTGKLAAIIPVHSHYDHAMDAPEVAKRTGALLLGSSSTAMIGRGWGLSESQIKVAELGKPYTFGKFTVTLYPSVHAPTGFTGGTIDAPLVPPQRAFAYKEGQSYAVLVEHSGKRVLITGTAGWIPGALKDVRADVVMLGIGALGTQTDAYRDQLWAEVVGNVKPQRVIAIHWDDFWIPSEGPMQPMPPPLDKVDVSLGQLQRLAQRDKIELRLPLEWKAMDVFAGLATQK